MAHVAYAGGLLQSHRLSGFLLQPAFRQLFEAKESSLEISFVIFVRDRT
jgi:hypothetical protein